MAYFSRNSKAVYCTRIINTIYQIINFYKGMNAYIYKNNSILKYPLATLPLLGTICWLN